MVFNEAILLQLQRQTPFLKFWSVLSEFNLNALSKSIENVLLLRFKANLSNLTPQTDQLKLLQIF